MSAFCLSLFSLPTLSKTRNEVWSIGLSGRKPTLKSGDGYDLVGTAAQIQMGYGRLWEKFYLLGSLDVQLGPFRASHKNSLSLDFSGTGFTLIAGYSADEQNLRVQSGNYGFALGVSYADIVGRSLSGNSFLKQGETIKNFKMRLTNLSLIPALFFCWLKPARKLGNSAPLLSTSLEGYFLTLGIAIPLRAAYKITRNRYPAVEENKNTISTEQQVAVKEKSEGLLHGSTLVITYTALLGP